MDIAGTATANSSSLSVTELFEVSRTYEGSIARPISQHKYLYAHTNPVNFTDPTGFFAVAEFSAANAIRSTLSGINVDTGQNLVLAALGDEPIPDSFVWETALDLGLLVSAGVVFSLASRHAKTVIDHIDGIAVDFRMVNVMLVRLNWYGT